MRTATLPDVPKARRLGDRRRALEIPQHELARAAGIPSGTLANYELGRCPIPDDRLAALEGALRAAEQRQTIVNRALREPNCPADLGPSDGHGSNLAARQGRIGPPDPGAPNGHRHDP